MVDDYLAVVAWPHNGAHPTAIAGNTHVHLLPVFIGLDVGVLQATCMGPSQVQVGNHPALGQAAHRQPVDAKL